MSDRAFWLAWSQIDGVGPTLILRLKHYFGDLSYAWEASVEDLVYVDGFGLQTAQAAAQGRSRIDPYQLLEQHERENPGFWTPADPDYPKLLLEIPDPPPVLYYAGQVDRQENQGLIPAIAIVGTRKPSDYGRRWTRRIVTALCNAGYPIVSGLADGIDTEAHRTCIQANARTIAVLGTGVDVVYPYSNRQLARHIRETGLLLSEYPAGTQPDRVHFPRRNRIIAGVCRAVLVLEAPSRSGALITARLANDYNRDVYALPGSLDNPQSLGCLELIQNGANLILSESALLDRLREIPSLQAASGTGQQLSLLDALAETSPQSQSQDPAAVLNLSSELQTILHQIPKEAIALDHIVAGSGLSTDVVLGALLHLELEGWVMQLPGMRYQRV
ncbi:MAG: DNA-protecting protein DprA [Synechococcales cyanobacterium T60_A2020_003]|nr:DNA-protecting protein DprA [Synechococcales cyanobacterium T60_A2020_003]